MSAKMKVEIWSDVMCPFCYIGKRKFEKALQGFSKSDDVELEWKSFQLSPAMKTDPSINIHQFLAKHKGISLEQATTMNTQVTELAAEAGLTYNFDQAVVANSFKAHRFSHFAKKHGKQHEAEEALFKAYFTEGKNIDDNATLLALGTSIGLNANELQQVLESSAYADDVREDIAEAQQVGARGVPFFVFNRKYAVSGAQQTEVFSEVLNNSYNEWRQENPLSKPEVIEGNRCTSDGCD